MDNLCRQPDTGMGLGCFQRDETPTENEVCCSVMLKHEDCPRSFFHTTLDDCSDYDPQQPEKKTKHEILCWHCCCQFKLPAIGLPYAVQKKYTYLVYGKFCSFRCALGFLREHPAFSSPFIRMNLIEMASRVYGINAKHLRAAPSRFALKMFGGHLSVEDFHRGCKQDAIVLHQGTGVSFQMIRMSHEHRQQNDVMQDVDSCGGSNEIDTARWSVFGIRKPLESKKFVSHPSQNIDGLYKEFVESRGGIVSNKETKDKTTVSNQKKERKKRTRKDHDTGATSSNGSEGGSNNLLKFIN